MSSKAVLLVNLGSPKAADTVSVRAYLNEFLMDPYVITLPWLLRRLLVSILILPTRPKVSSHAYQSIWTEQGSPLIVLSKSLLKALQAKSRLPVALAMRYGSPSIETELLKLASDNNIDEIVLLPLYPHYAESTITTSVKEVGRVITSHSLNLKLTVIKPFFDQKDYISALVNTSKPLLEANDGFEHILFSYHGLPEAHIKKADPGKNHCLMNENCCSQPSLAHQTCYRHQVLRTTQCFVEKAGIKPEQYSISFQSRLGRQQWLEPSTENSLRDLAQKGIKNLLVICPAFVTDCLETLEEIELQGTEIFKQAGGETLTLIPCLNDQPEWIATLAKWINNEELTE